MTRLNKGDTCPLCGNPIITDDPFSLGYLSALADVKALGSLPTVKCPDGMGLEVEDGKVVAATEAALFRLYLAGGYDDLIGFDEYRCRFERRGGRILEATDGQAD